MTTELRPCTLGCGDPTIRVVLVARGPYPLWRSGAEWMPSATISIAGIHVLKHNPLPIMRYKQDIGDAQTGLTQSCPTSLLKIISCVWR